MVIHVDEYISIKSFDLYNSPACNELATQVAEGRHLVIVPGKPQEKAVRVQLLEDGYYAWLCKDNEGDIQPASAPYQPIHLGRPDIETRIPDVIAFMKAAMDTPNRYLWGGNLAPDYDCSGLMQSAFASQGVWIPRDSYQQEEFCRKIHIGDLAPGDMVFFGDKRINHVGLYLGDGYYIHSSGKETGRNGIGVDILSDDGDEISRHYFKKLWSSGRVTRSLVVRKER